MSSFSETVFLLFLFLAVFLILKLDIRNRTNNSRVARLLVTDIKTWLVAQSYSLLLLLSGDVELNPGPKHNSSNVFSIFHWNLNIISSHNYAKVFLFKTYIAIHKFDISFTSETHLDSSTTSDDNNLGISRYILVRSYHPSNNKIGGVCIYYETFLPSRNLNLQCLEERIQSGLADSFPSTILTKNIENKNRKIFTDQLQKLISYEFLAGQELRTDL